jgi:hypothetical protein
MKKEKLYCVEISVPNQAKKILIAMPVYLHLFNLVIDKKAVIRKYTGGIAQFRIDYDILLSEINQEDDELFSLGQMNADQFDIDSLISKGLSYDIYGEKSEDFTIVYRYGDLLWDVKWLEHNRVFAWHIDISDDVKLKMNKVCEMTMDDLVKQMEKGNNLLKPIRLEHL